jgi:hypothetical protein
MEGVFGTITFGKVAGVRTFFDIHKKSSGRFNDHPVHLQKPRLERAGNDLIEIKMKMVLNAAWSGDPHRHLALFHFYQENNLAAPLIIGGKPLGPLMSMFVITDLVEHHTHWLRVGQLLRATLDISFLEYIPIIV